MGKRRRQVLRRPDTRNGLMRELDARGYGRHKHDRRVLHACAATRIAIAAIANVGTVCVVSAACVVWHGRRTSFGHHIRMIVAGSLDRRRRQRDLDGMFRMSQLHTRGRLREACAIGDQAYAQHDAQQQ
jgi:hypothetical protein